MDTFDLTIYQGETYSLSLTLSNGSGVPIDLTNFAISGFLKRQFSDTGKLCDLNVTKTVPSSGEVTLNIAATGTASLPVGFGFYDIEMLNSGDNSVTKVLKGKASIFPEVTY